MAFKEESPNEGMERLQESFLQTGWPCRSRGGRDGELSLWAHMIGSLISAQFCPRNATDQQTGCQQTQASFAEVVMRCFLMDESTFSVSTCPLRR